MGGREIRGGGIDSAGWYCHIVDFVDIWVVM